MDGERKVIMVIISIHAPRVGRDIFAPLSAADRRRFQSTRPVWGATTCTLFLSIK